jgi:membrane-associated HD superfamily phosphohydrolase
MTLKNYLFVMSALTAVCWGIFIFVAALIDPTITNWLGLALFYLALFLALSGTIALMGFIFRYFALKKELAFYLVRRSFRQALTLSLFIIILLILKSQGLFNWLNLTLLIVIFVVGELFLSGYKKSRA